MHTYYQLDVYSAEDDAFRKQLVEWRRLAERVLGKNNVHVLCVPGNDDPEWVDEHLETAPFFNLDLRSFQHSSGFRFLGVGGSNHTPWGTPREFTEDQLAERLDRFSNNKSVDGLIAVTHVPPHASGLDMAPKLKNDLSYELVMGQPVVSPVGSSAVREFVERVQPLLLISGHVHEARGSTRIGRTLCINPGSLYNSGVLLGCIVELRGNRIASVEFTEG